MIFNARGAYAIFKNELMRMFRTAFGSILSPVITTSLYLVVFGAAMSERVETDIGVPYGAFIVPGLLMLTLLSESTSNASFGIYMPKFTGAIYELLSAPVGVVETLIGFVGAAAVKSLILAAIILGTAALIVDYQIAYPLLAFGYILLVAATFSLLGFIIGLWANSFEKLQIIPLLVLMPLTFLGGTFYSIDVLPEPWRSVSLINPVVYLVNGLRWTFLGESDFPIALSFGMTMIFLLLCIGIIWWIFRTGWRLRD
ncbi:ABC transporter permease [Aurantiacibacter gangjinensis]|uniref:Transport permease protein n=1 Tax=Aurantiacibacter gangjinensis TaxID=502682 RepID=A0A0G9MQH6_9SPHN|nr:ABC transporter permease [Aurantiacibacter gangjinensis]APE28644.1 ABC-type multidrug transport system, permease component [Aurantiacibacter gangjinensis]KLE32819.1 sugar ABC transporter permease [Aurantiacibacter gangjinensis]